MTLPYSNGKCSKAFFVIVASFLISSQIYPSQAANVLFFIGFGGPSHRIAMEPLADALVKNGHNVTFLIQEKPKDKETKIQYYVPQKVAEFFINMRGEVNFYDMRVSGSLALQSLFVQWFGTQVCESLYTDPNYLEWLKSNKFDLVIIDGLFNECGYGIAHVHKAKTILFSISTILPWVVDSLGIPDETSSIPDPMLPFPQERTFFQRVLTGVLPVVWRLVRQLYYFPKLEKITREGLGDKTFPSFSELEKNTSLVLVNTHVSQEYPRSLPPNFIPVGGISWVDKRKPLPKRFEDFINEGKEGFVYVSFGSFIDFLTFPEEVQQRFINALLRFPNIQFIWKLSKVPANLPKNFLVEKWLPQQDLLRKFHPKIRAFVTHSGIGGVNEAIYSSVPLICFPIFTEQDYNAYLVEKKGFGIKMEITKLTEDAMEGAIKEILTNNSYRTNMKKVTNQFLDRPMGAVETALWWTEYVLRQENTDFLRPLNVNQSWWVKRHVDVWLFVLASILISSILSIYISYKVLSRCLKCVRGNGNKTKSKHD